MAQRRSHSSGSGDKPHALARPREDPQGRAGRSERGYDEGPAVAVKQAQPVDVGGAEGHRLADDGRTRLRLVDLQADREIAREEPKADGDPIGMEAVADQMIEIVPVDQFVDRLLDPPALPVERGEATGAEPLNPRDAAPGAPPIRRRAGAERQELQAR